MAVPDLKPKPPDGRIPVHLAEAIVRTRAIVAELRRFVDEEMEHDGNKPGRPTEHIQDTPEPG